MSLITRPWKARIPHSSNRSIGAREQFTSWPIKANDHGVVGKVTGPSSPFAPHQQSRSQDVMIHVQREMKAGKEKWMQTSCLCFRQVKLRHSRVAARVPGSKKAILMHTSFSKEETEEEEQELGLRSSLVAQVLWKHHCLLQPPKPLNRSPSPARTIPASPTHQTAERRAGRKQLPRHRQH